LIELDAIAKTYGHGEGAVHALRALSLRVVEGEALAILGPSGSGKTTLLDILGALSHPSSGAYHYRGQDVFALSQGRIARVRNRHFGFVFQAFNLLPGVTAARNVALPLQYSAIPRSERRERVRAALESVGLSHKHKALSNELSGGEQQRVAIARAIVADPSVILADEPTGNLDSRNGVVVMDLLFRLRDRGKTIVVVTHNEELARRFPRIIRILDGGLVYDGPPGKDDRP
jgi:putative ABC transport system ATP-binding protein